MLATLLGRPPTHSERWHTACDVCGTGVCYDEVTLVCEHKACPCCMQRLVKQQEEFNVKNLGVCVWEVFFFGGGGGG